MTQSTRYIPTHFPLETWNRVCKDRVTLSSKHFYQNKIINGKSVSWLSRGPDSSGEAWIGCKRLILKLSKVLLGMEVEGPCMHANWRLILI
jgi:hypothetical protein